MEISKIYVLQNTFSTGTELFTFVENSNEISYSLARYILILPIPDPKFEIKKIIMK